MPVVQPQMRIQELAPHKGKSIKHIKDYEKRGEKIRELRAKKLLPIASKLEEFEEREKERHLLAKKGNKVAPQISLARAERKRKRRQRRAEAAGPQEFDEFGYAITKYELDETAARRHVGEPSTTRTTKETLALKYNAIKLEAGRPEEEEVNSKARVFKKVNVSSDPNRNYGNQKSKSSSSFYRQQTQSTRGRASISGRQSTNRIADKQKQEDHHDEITEKHSWFYAQYKAWRHRIKVWMKVRVYKKRIKPWIEKHPKLENWLGVNKHIRMRSLRLTWALPKVVLTNQTAKQRIQQTLFDREDRTNFRRAVMLYQAMAIMARVISVDVQWPQFMIDIGKWLKEFTFSLSLFKPECSASSAYWQTWLGITILPYVMMIPVFISYAVSSWMVFHNIPKEEITKAQLAALRGVFLDVISKLVIIWLLLCL